MNSLISGLIVAAAVVASPQAPPLPPAGGPCGPAMCRPASPQPPKHVHKHQPRPCERCAKPARPPKPEPCHKHHR